MGLRAAGDGPGHDAAAADRAGVALGEGNGLARVTRRHDHGAVGAERHDVELEDTAADVAEPLDQASERFTAFEAVALPEGGRDLARIHDGPRSQILLDRALGESEAQPREAR